LRAEGTAAPDFELEDLAGKVWRLRDQLVRGPVLLAFFKISCPTCQLAFPFLQRMLNGAGPNAPQVVGVSQDDATGTSQFQQRFGVSMRTLLDPPRDFAVSNAYQISHVPSLFLIEASATLPLEGRISMAIEGFSKAHLEKLGERFGVSPFTAQDRVPVMQPG
jgi:peroxiredoxin